MPLFCTTYEYFAFEIDSMTALLLDKNTWVNYGCIVIRNYPLGNALLTSVTFPGKRQDDHIPFFLSERDWLLLILSPSFLSLQTDASDETRLAAWKVPLDESPLNRLVWPCRVGDSQPLQHCKYRISETESDAHACRGVVVMLTIVN